MAETGIFASINGVAGAGFRLSLILNAVRCQIPNAPAEIHAISKSVTLFSLLLKQTAAALDRPSSVHSEEALRTVEQIVQESNAVFQEINTMLERMRSKKEDGITNAPSITQRFEWCFQKHGVLYLLSRIDRLQMSLSLMLQIFQLGASMASTSRTDSPERVKEMTDRIRRERVEAQNVIVLYYTESKEVERLYQATQQEELETKSSNDSRKAGSKTPPRPASSDTLQLTKNDSSKSLSDICLPVKPPAGALNEIDDQWRKLDHSPEEMIRVSDQIIDNLLQKWTIWRERREQSSRQNSSTRSSRYRTNVQDFYDDDDIPYADRYQERENGFGGRLLEGHTTDWRQPHSTDARQNAARLKKAYAGYQPSVSAPGSDADDSPGSAGSKRRAPKKHVLDSGSDSSEAETTEAKPHTRTARKSSNPQTPEQVEKEVVPALMTRSLSSPSADAGPAPRIPPPTARSTMPAVSASNQRRPYATPNQSPQYHSFSTPGPVHNTHNGPYQYSPGAVAPVSTTYAPSYQNQPTYYVPPNQATTPPSTRYLPRLSPQSAQIGSQRPVSRDGKPPKSPSRLSHTSNAYPPPRSKETEEERRARKKQHRREIGDRAATGLLAGGGLVALLEALEAFDI